METYSALAASNMARGNPSDSPLQNTGIGNAPPYVPTQAKQNAFFDVTIPIDPSLSNGNNAFPYPGQEQGWQNGVINGGNAGVFDRFRRLAGCLMNRPGKPESASPHAPKNALKMQLAKLRRMG